LGSWEYMSVGSTCISHGGQAYNALVGVLGSDGIATELGGSNISPGQSDSRSGFGHGREAGAAPGSSQAFAAL
jgi:hypothetical protein